MFMLYALVAGIVIGVALGGHLEGVAALHLRWAPLLVGGLLAQLLLFSDPVTARVGDLGPALYVGTTLLVFAAILRNRAIPGMPVVAVGAASNLVAIVSNGGYMPASPGALEVLHRGEATVYSNSVVVAQPALPWLTDIFALPRWLPGTNIYSIGDVLIGIGIAAVVVFAMRSRPRAGAGAPAH